MNESAEMLISHKTFIYNLWWNDFKSRTYGPGDNPKLKSESILLFKSFNFEFIPLVGGALLVVVAGS